MQVIKECRDCEYYISRDFKCDLATGYAHNPKDYCLRKGHIFEIPQCVDCKFYNSYDFRCKKIDRFMDLTDFCSMGEYNER